jgi:riboflavin synthase
MFTGIITDLGRVAHRAHPIAGATDVQFKIETHFDMTDVALGASIACNGCCLTVTAKG